VIDVSKYIGVKFAEKGRGPRFDCWGLVMEILDKEYSITGLPDFKDRYAHTGDYIGIGSCIDQEKRNWKEVDAPQEGAVIVFNIKGRPHHVGICTGYQQGQAWFFHVYEGTTAKHERLKSTMWANRINSIYVYE